MDWRYYADFVTVPVMIVALMCWVGFAGVLLTICGFLLWTLAEYLIHRFWMHASATGWRLHKQHHDRPVDHDAERSSASTPLLVGAVGLILVLLAGVETGAALLTGVLIGYFAFIVVHHAVHRWPLEPDSWLYPAKMRHVAHHHFNDCNFGVITPFWDIVFWTRH